MWSGLPFSVAPWIGMTESWNRACALAASASKRAQQGPKFGRREVKSSVDVTGVAATYRRHFHDAVGQQPFQYYGACMGADQRTQGGDDFGAGSHGRDSVQQRNDRLVREKADRA